MRAWFLFILIFSFNPKSFSQIIDLNELIKMSRIPSVSIKDSIQKKFIYSIDSNENSICFYSCEKISLNHCDQWLKVKIDGSVIQLLTRDYHLYKAFKDQTKENNLKRIERKKGRFNYKGADFKIEFSQECMGKRAAFSIKLIRE